MKFLRDVKVSGQSVVICPFTVFDAWETAIIGERIHLWSFGDWGSWSHARTGALRSLANDLNARLSGSSC